MANCNCNDFPISCAPHAPGGDCCHPHGCPPHPHPCPPPPFKGGTSMYIGARYVPIFADPVEWDDEREYEPLTIVVHNGDCYTSKCYVPKGAQLPPYPEGQTKYWVKTSDYNYQFADLKKTVTDLSRLVEQFQKDNESFTELINGWNEKVIQWEKDMAAWGERLDAVESNVADLTASLNAEIDRAKTAEQANADAIAQETADRKQAVSELDAAYKAADAAEAQAREEADTALSNRITTNTTDIDAIKAEQVIQNTNISANAKNIQDNAAEIAKHAKRLTDLESNASDWDETFPDTTIAQEMKNEQTARANGDTALNGLCEAIAADVEEVRDIANHKVDQTVFQAADAMNVKYVDETHGRISTPTLVTIDLPITHRSTILCNPTNSHAEYGWKTCADLALKTEVDTAQADADKANSNIGDWETDHPGQTISQCVTSQETELEEHAGDITRLEADKADKSEIPDVSGFVTTQTYTQGQAEQDAKIDANTAALADKADKSEIPNVSGFVTTQTYTQGQAAQDAKIDANTAALADKADKSEFVTNAKQGEVFPIFLSMHTASDYYLPTGIFNGSSIVFLIPTSKFFQDGTLLNLCDRYGTKQEGRPYTYRINKNDGVIYTDITVDNGYYLRPIGTAALLELFPSLTTVQKLKHGETITLRELKMVDTDLFMSVENITKPES